MTKEGGKLTDSAADNLTCLAFCAAKFELRTMHRGFGESLEALNCLPRDFVINQKMNVLEAL